MTLPLTSAPRPASARPAIFYPSGLATYLQCPEKYFHRYVERRPVDELFSPNLAKGIAAHGALQQIFEHYRALDRFLGDAAVRSLVTGLLPRPPYPSEIAWTTDVEAVLRQIEWALGEWDAAERVVATERTVSYPYPGDPSSGCPPFVLRHKIDRLTAAGSGLVCTDYKGGGSRPDRLYVVSALIGVRHSYPDATPIRAATMFLNARRTVIEELTRDEVRQTWALIKRTITFILSEEIWRPEPTALCAYCAYDAGGGCSLASPDTAGDSIDPTTHWLEA